MHSDWLVNSYTIDEALEYIIEQLDPRDMDEFNVSTGMKKWREFVEHVKDGDEVWYFDSGRASFLQLAGRSGFSIVRNGEIVGSFTLFMS